MKRKRLIPLVSIIATVTAAISLYMIVSTFVNGRQEQNAFYGKAIAKCDPGFRYYQYTDLTDPDVFAEYMEQVNAAAFYDTGITVEYGDELITLSTCSYHTDNGRFVVVAKKK